jgi:hypothetical protein
MAAPLLFPTDSPIIFLGCMLLCPMGYSGATRTPKPTHRSPWDEILPTRWWTRLRIAQLRRKKEFPKMEEKGLDANLKAQMVFDYYKQQREEFLNLSRERSSLSLQFLVILGALGAAFFQASSILLKFGVTAVMVILGLLGLIINISIGREMRMYVERARAARKSLGFLEEFADVRPSASSSWKGIRQDNMYLASMILIIVVGLVFALTVIVR